MDAVVIHIISHSRIIRGVKWVQIFCGDSSKMSEDTLISTIMSDETEYLSTLSISITDISGTQDILSTIVGDLSGVPIRIPLSINDLLNSYEATVVKETADRSAVASFTAPSVESLKPALYKWAAAGFPAGYKINTITIAPPTLCSDGVNRKLTFYFEWLLGKPIADWLQALDDVTDGMIFTFSHDGTNKITLHVTRT